MNDDAKVIEVLSDGRLLLDGRAQPCALGRGGVIEATAKREGDGMTPLGDWPIRRLLYRPDKLPARGLPATALAAEPIDPQDGWCDDPGDPAYNRPVALPYPASHERMWREDGAYDLVVVLGHNDDPPAPGMGSAIFLHLAKPGFTPTEGCVAVEREVMEALLGQVRADDVLRISRAE
jgi:L,D-peptidoglycan transpeptidase YkuD (ErfK/YbiS/YcfS/YnhG family)